VKRESALRAILDSEDEVEPVKVEALRELNLICDLQQTHFVELSGPAQEIAERVSGEMLSLHASLTVAVDAQGNAHPVIRAFALHLLVYIVIPSLRSSIPGAIPRFTYASPSR